MEEANDDKYVGPQSCAFKVGRTLLTNPPSYRQQPINPHTLTLSDVPSDNSHYGIKKRKMI